jgi:predicted unusual protein kinase regulating ubiquinone biosynthesis (AarF/ABC1/UbiB family)
MLFKMLPLLLYIRITCRHRAKGSKRWNRLQTHAGNVFSDSMLKLGPLYIKLGQILSCREKLLPEQWKTAMERLQDQVPSKSGKDAEELAYNAWPGGKAKFDETFSEMDWTPLAAASLGQVHKARLAGIGNDNNNDGDAVALKLQRPYLREIYDKDFALLTKVASIVDKYFGSSAGSVGGVSQSWTEIFEDAEEILYREIDYRDEAENGIRFCRDFGLAKGGQAAKNCTAKSFDGKPLPSAAPWLRAPYVYDDLSTEKVLVMENVPSIKITASDKLDEANVTAEDREYLADCLGRSYLRQFCCNRFCTSQFFFVVCTCCFSTTHVVTLLFPISLQFQLTHTREILGSRY